MFWGEKNAINIFHSIANSINCRNSSDNVDDSKLISLVEIVPFTHTYVKCGDNERMSSWLSIWDTMVLKMVVLAVLLCVSRKWMIIWLVILLVLLLIVPRCNFMNAFHYIKITIEQKHVSTAIDYIHLILLFAHNSIVFGNRMFNASRCQNWWFVEFFKSKWNI